MTSLSPDRTRLQPSDYAVLSRLVRGAGLLQRRRGAYAAQISATMLFYLSVAAVVGWLGDTWYQLLLAAALAVAFTQVAFLGHDGGHQQVFSRRRANDLFGQLTGNLLVGLSYGWWIDKHNRHHANPNTEDHDPDIGDGVLAFTTNQVAAKTGRLGQAIIRRQAWLFFPLLTLEAWHLHIASVRSLAPGARRSRRGGNKYLEIALLILHFACYLGALLFVMSPVKAVAFIAIHQALFGLYMGCSFAPNHKGMTIFGPTEDIDYLRRQVLSSRNVRGGVLTDVLLGGLNYQIEHHLFPNMPRPSLRRAQTIVRSYCVSHRITYTEASLIGSYTAALRHLHQLGAPLRSPAAGAGLTRPGG
ncbi:acyl-CoA desaturase [Jatrophihabitans telluris]|uniref:Acyl-CoA desaturase n=1 Tax=Jatrophihabitans telluris TaxID=2038343 RepID=A0ABY4QTB5_9ACTN|nr:acyl-CoA desaturase [Jatrophihabitans telluris]UQX86913.1 acyl-CoA desaturase [Jatrophihabitans telluris]